MGTWTAFGVLLSATMVEIAGYYIQDPDSRFRGSNYFLTKEEFLSGCHELMGYLRGKLHNHDITIEVVVNETVENKYAFTTQEKFERLKQINPTIELLRKTFDLDV